jgi:hypothetical protein
MTDQEALDQQVLTTYFGSSPERVGDGTAGGYFDITTPGEAEEAMMYFAKRCSNCQYEERCPGESCAIYRAEKRAGSILRGIPVEAGVPIRESIT